MEKKQYTVEFGVSVNNAHYVEIFCEEKDVVNIAYAIYRGWANDQGKNGYCTIYNNSGYNKVIVDCM